VRVFVYEFITGGGLFDAGWWPAPESLLCEGAAMAGAVIRDFAACSGVSVTLLWDQRLPRPEFAGGCDVADVGSADDHQRAFSQ